MVLLKQAKRVTTNITPGFYGLTSVPSLKTQLQTVIQFKTKNELKLTNIGY
jgi:hypothetical protein